MKEDLFSKLWWDNVTGPMNLVARIVTNLRNKKSVLLKVPEDLPWRKQMRSSAEYALRDNEVDLLITYIDCRDDCPEIEDVAEYLMQRFAQSDVRNGYRSSSGITIQKYMLNSGVLKKRVLWIKGMDDDNVRAWYDFCKKYQPNTIYDGLFVIESYGDLQFRGIPSHIERVNYRDYISQYDALLFNSRLVAEKSLSTEWRQYIATVTTTLCQCDVELSEYLIGETDFSSMDPVTQLITIAQSERFKIRSDADNLGKSHPFYLLRTNNLDELYRRIWQAQLQIIFPIIEAERITFVNRWEREIKDSLNSQYYDCQTGGSSFIRQYGIRLTNPLEVELGTLTYLMQLRKSSNTAEYMLYIPDEKHRIRLELLHRMRNSLAHMKVCPVKDINDLLT